MDEENSDQAFSTLKRKPLTVIATNKEKELFIDTEFHCLVLWLVQLKDNSMSRDPC
ncbi:hypothetical protein COCC4DRAFT_33122 [Bipolaris maydis ATCC 48331]|uniref:Uncharacterized protein n=2 Tax=Cochliobolus heterostrophus TaxID=5016 RepID=M2UJ28_COCH5|nr:uncharacterized protein COCC4DRAFT_33122 [Bipolaris maydis ATCC 48331]EMD87998.1 hypothetical protein COCHEDRAFT_1023267 [Bipolaris maydis C5]ENI03514.1 hypothetical protein COCC4DRAFT_33122 [Bipolaris maydis ATCC 48331]